MRDEGTKGQSDISAAQNGFAEFKSSEPADESAASIEAISLPPAILALQAKLKTAYTQSSGLKLLLDERREFSLRDLFVDLELITTFVKQKAGVEQGEVVERDPTLRREFYKVLEEQRTAIEPEQLFSALKDNPAPTRIWLEGAAGTGKTTLCRYLAYRWATVEDDKAFWPQFKLMIYLPLREIVDRYDKAPYGLRSFLLGPWDQLTIFKDQFGEPLINEADKTALWEFIQAYRQAVVFLLDGFDEVPEQHPAVQALVKYAPCYLLSSRPHLAPADIQREVETRGFSPEHIRQYTERYFKLIEADEAESKGLLAWLEHNPHLLGLSQVPLNCQMICAAWHSKALPEQPTLTQLYETLMAQWQRRALKRLGKIPEHSLEHYEPKALNAACSTWMEILHELAFKTLRGEASVLISGAWLEEAIEQSLILQEKVFSEAETEKQKQILANEVLNLGIIVRQKHHARLFSDRYEVIHLTFMEYLVADYLAKGMSQEPGSPAFIVAKDSIERYQAAERFNIVWWFMAGRLATLAPNRLNLFFRLLVTGTIQDPYGFDPSLQLIRCAEEARIYANRTTETLCVPAAFTKSLLQLAAIWFRWLNAADPSQYVADEGLSRRLVQAFSTSPIFLQALVTQKFNGFMGYVRKENFSKINSETFNWLISVSSKENIQAVFVVFKAILADKVNFLSHVVDWHFNAILPKLSNKQCAEVWPLLKAPLIDEDEGIRSAAVKLFKAILPKLSNKQCDEILSDARECSVGKNKDIRSTAVELFKAMLLRLSVERCAEVWDLVKARLADRNSDIRFTAVELFEAMLPRLSVERCAEVWPLLTARLADEDKDVNYRTVALFGAMLPRLSVEQCTEVLPLLAAFLAVEDRNDHYGIIKFFQAKFSFLSEKQCEVVLDWIKEHLADENSRVSYRTLELFKTILPRLSEGQCNEVWDWIKDHLADENSFVHSRAIKLFEAMLPRLSEDQCSEIWNLVNKTWKWTKKLLSNKNGYRFAALELFKDMLPHLSISQCIEILPLLIAGLTDKNESVHYMAVELLMVMLSRQPGEQLVELWSLRKAHWADYFDPGEAIMLFEVILPSLSAEQSAECWPLLKGWFVDKNIFFSSLSSINLFRVMLPRISKEQIADFWPLLKVNLGDRDFLVHFNATEVFRIILPELSAELLERDLDFILRTDLESNYFYIGTESFSTLLNRLSPGSVLRGVNCLQTEYERSTTELLQQKRFRSRLCHHYLPAFLNYFKTCPPDYKNRIQSALHTLFQPIQAPEHDALCRQLLSDLPSSDSLIALPKTKRRNSMPRSTEITSTSTSRPCLAIVDLSSLPLRMMELSHLAESVPDHSLVRVIIEDGDRAAAHISQLIARGGLPALHYQDEEGNTLLHYAVLCGHMNVVEQLTKYHLSTANHLGLQAMHLAVLCGQESIAHYLWENGAPQASISVTYTHPMLKESIAIACTPLQLAVAVGQIEIAESLLADDRCRAQIQLSGIGGHLLHLAVLANQTQMLVRLLNNPELKRKINETDVNGRTPLSLAAYVNNAKAISLLCQAGADKHAISALGRTPLHEAVEGRALEALEVLISEFVDLSLEDESRNKARNVAHHYKAEQTADPDQFFIFKTMENWLENAERERRSAAGRPPQVRQLFSRYKNLIFQGGGAKGIAYVGALQELACLKLLPQIQRVGGTSAGAITATLLAVGYTPDELLLKLREKNLGDFLEGVSFESGALGLIKETLAQGYHQLYERSGLSWNSAWQALKPWHVLHSVTGLIEGKDFLAWIEALIKEKTGIDHCTFGELSAKTGVGGSCRHLHLVASRLGEGQKIEVFSSEDIEWKDLVISEAVRASMSIPAVFKPYSPRWKSIEGRLYSKTFEGQATLYADGGLLMNYPIELFDRQKYQRDYLTEDANRELVIINNETLGFSLKYKPAGVVKVDDITTMTEAAKALLNFYYDAETLMGQLLQRGQHRTITIDPRGISTLEFSLSAAQQALLMESGQEATAQFFAPISSVTAGMSSAGAAALINTQRGRDRMAAVPERDERMGTAAIASKAYGSESEERSVATKKL